MGSCAALRLTRKPLVDVRCVESTSEGAGFEMSTADTDIARGCGGGRLVAAGGNRLREIDASEMECEGTTPPNNGAYARVDDGVLRGL